MKNLKANYATIAKIFAYPDVNFNEHVMEVQHYLDANIPEAGEILSHFTECITKLNLIEQQDLYLRSFEVQAVTTLDIGYVVFGDDYKRGELLVNLNREHHQAGIDCGNDLPDHLPNILKLMDVITDEEVLIDLVNKIITPALRKMKNGFEPGQIEAKDKIYKKHHKTLLEKHNAFTIYKYTLHALYRILELDFDVVEAVEHERSGGFLSSINQEIKIES